MKLAKSSSASDPDVTAEILCEQIFNYLEQGQGVESLTLFLREVESLPVEHPQRSALLRFTNRAITLGQRLEQHQKSERRLRAVFESAQALTELKDLNEVLFEIVEGGRKLLASDLAWLSGVNPVDSHWRVLALDGLHTTQARDMCPPIGTGVAGYVLRTRGPFATNNYFNDPRFEHDSFIDSTLNAEGLQSLVAVPLLSNAEVIGILIVGDRYVRTYLPWEISTLATLAAHASIAVRNARTYDMARNALKEAEEANQLLKAQTAALEFAADAHERVTKLLAKGSGLTELINLLAKILDGQVMFLDAAGIELCVATPPNYESPEVMGSEKLFSGIDSNIQSAVGQSRVGGRSVPTTTVSHLFCRVVAVMSGDELLGSLVIHTCTQLTEPAIRVFERSATATAVLRLSAEKKSASTYQDINISIRALLDPSQHWDKGLIERVKHFGLNLSAPVIFGIADIEKAKVGYGVRKLTERLRGTPFLATEIDHYIILLVNRDDIGKFSTDLEKLLFGDLYLSGVAALSGPYSEPYELANAYQGLKRSITLLRALGRENCIVQEAQLRMYAVLFQNHNTDQLDAVLESILGPLIKYDNQKGTRLLATLHAYLDHMQNARVTAKYLGIHVNTLHNRLEVISNLMGKWNTEGHVAEIYMALRLRQLKDKVQSTRTP
jgi:GAF domain-containing protein